MTRQSYPTDLTDKEWAGIESYLFISYDKGGRPLSYEKRELLNAIFYILRTGCQWRYMPHDFPPWTAVYKQYQRWKRNDIFEKMNYNITKDTRINIGRNPEPTAAIVDSQSIKTTEKGALKVTMGLKKSKVARGI